MQAQGLFITFEGGEGTGKSTQQRRLVAWFRERGREVVTTREPGGTPVAEAIRSILLDEDLEPDGLTELFLLQAARHDHVDHLIRPALERGAVVLSDRFADSSTVYQGMVRRIGASVVRQLNILATGGLEPDLTLVLDMDPAEALGRAHGRNAADGEVDRLDNEPLQFHLAIRNAFLRLAESLPERIRVVDADGGEELVFERLLAVVTEVLHDR
ncbi:MAG: dTMP kinase [Thermoanaerobaculales bacterium]|nr:dTMP kinase [Thermoanaerobaculales bacterium]